LRVFRIGESGFDRYLSEVEGRVAQDGPRLEREVRSILKDVRQRGDEALVHYTRLFDGVRIPVQKLRVKRGEVEEAYRKVPQEFLRTLKKAAHRILKFHQLSKKRLTVHLVEKGIWLGQMIRPIERAGIYVPGGKASYPSTVLMAAIPAKVAGVQEILMTTPPQKGGVNPAVLVAADLAGVDQIYRVGIWWLDRVRL
jgi:histidinol dehydrogenase